MTQIIDLVDSIEYTTTNCFAHQLHGAMVKCGTTTVQLADIKRYPNPGKVICRLKQRTLFRRIDEIATWVGRSPVVIFDQDPWHAYMDDSEFKGTYELAAARLNVKKFAVTAEPWVDFLARRGHPSMFVRMGINPEYCASGQPYADRSIQLGFVGSIHSYRKDLFDHMGNIGMPVNVRSGNTLGYRDYLRALQMIRVFIHDEHAPITIDGEQVNLISDGLWVKDIEAASQGCFSVRNSGVGHDSYLLGMPTGTDGLGLVRLYYSREDLPQVLGSIEKMDPNDRQSLINRTVEYLETVDRWQETAAAMVKTVSE